MTDSLTTRLGRLTPEQKAVLLSKLASSRATPKLTDHVDPARRRSRLGLDQERLWLLNQQNPSSSEYVLTFGLRLTGRFDRDSFVAALERAVQRHAILRSSVRVEDGVPKLWINDDAAIDLVEIDLRSVPDEERAGAARERMIQHVHRPFDLAAGPVLRVVVVRLGDDDHQIAQAMHHSTTDQWSYALMNREVLADYDDLVNGRALEAVPTPGVQFGDFAEWQRAYFASDAGRRHLEFWSSYLEGAPGQTQLPYDRPPDDADRSGEHFTFVLDADVGRAFLETVRSLGMTVSSGLVAAYAGLLYEETGQRDVIVGLPSVTRGEPGSADIFGFLLSTLPFRIQMPSEPTLRDVLTAVRTSATRVADHRETPFALIVEAAAPARALSQYPLVQTAHVHLDFDDTRFADDEATRVYANAVPEDVSPMDITVAWWQAGDQFYGRFEYRRSLFDRETIARLARRLLELVASMATDVDSPLRRPHEQLPRVENVLSHTVHGQDVGHAADDGAVIEVVRGTWAELTGDEAFDADSSFFDGAGASLLSVQLVQLLEHDGIVCSIADVFESGTPRALARHLARSGIRVDLVEGDAPVISRHVLSPQQEALLDWGFSRVEQFAHSVVLSLPTRVDQVRLRDALRHVVVAHPTLRTTIVGDEAVVSPPSAEALCWVDGVDASDATGVAHAHRALLDLRDGPLFVASFHAATNQLVLTAHHLVIDGYSWNVVIDDIRAAYDGDEVVGERVTYGDHVAAFTECDARPQSSYWLRQMQADAASTWALQGVNDYSDEITLVREVQGARGLSLDDLALASLLTALVRGGRAPAVSRIVLGREPVHGLAGWKAHRAVGYYSSFHPFCPDVDGHDAGEDLLEVKRARRQVPDGGKSFLLARSQDSRIATAFADGRYPDVTFNYLGAMARARAGEWSRVDEIAGGDLSTSLRSSLVDVSVSVDDDRAVMTWAFNPRAADTDAITRCANEMQAVLAGHLSARDVDAPSPGLLDVSESDLDALFSDLTQGEQS